MALPVVLAGCSQDDLVSESVVATAPDAKAIDNVTFTIAKDAPVLDGVESRADWVNNKIKFEKSDKVSLYWLGSDGWTQNNTDGDFIVDINNQEEQLTGALTGKSNAVFRTEDGAGFTAEAVVYEGYNLLVYPADVKHTTAKQIVVGLPTTQKAADNFAEHAIYVGDSILHIHQPSKKTSNGKFYDIYGNVATSEDPNTSGYAHGVKTGVKLLTSLLHMDLRIANAPANDVVIKKVVLTTKEHVASPTKSQYLKAYNIWGNLKAAGTVQSNIANQIDADHVAKYLNPWFEPNDEGKSPSVTLDFTGVTTNVNGSTKGTMLLLPTNIATTQPVLQVHTNYGVVTIGGDVLQGDAQTNAVYMKDGIEKAADNDNQALLDIVNYASNYVAKLSVYDANATDKKQDYEFNSGVSMTRVIKVDMAKAQMSGMAVNNTDELNALLKAAVTNPNNKFDSNSPLEVILNHNDKGEFELTNYEGLEAFVKKFDNGALTLNTADGVDYTDNGKAFTRISVNTTTDKVLKNIEGLASDVKLYIPETSAIEEVKNGNNVDGVYTIANSIINETTISVPAKAALPVSDNEKGTIVYTHGATLNFQYLPVLKWGKVYFEAKTKTQFDAAVQAGVNYVKVDGLATTFFSEGIDVTTSTGWTHLNTGVTVEFSNCGNLNETVEGTIKAKAIVLSNGTSYPDLTSATVEKIIVKSATATLGYPATETAKQIASIEIAEGTTAINNLDIVNLTVKEGATANMDAKTAALSSTFYVFGTASFTGSNRQADQKVFVDNNNNGKIDGINVINGNCLVTGKLTLANNLAYANVAVAENTNIAVATGVTGLGYTTKIFVTKDAQAKGTANLKFLEEGYNSSKISWNGNFSDLTWTGI